MLVVDEKQPLVVDVSTNIVSIAELRNAKAVRSVVEKLYGIRYSLTEVLNENALHNQEAQGTV